MEYCNLGRSGLEVSRIALGAIPFGSWLDDKESRNMAVLNLRLSEEEMQELKNVSELPAPCPMNFWNQFCYRESRHYGGGR